MPHDRRFRFGVIVRSSPSAAAFRDTVRRIEDHGYSTLFVPDHFVEHPLAPFPALAMAAEATSTLRLGTYVLGNDYKHPVVVATEAATVDLLSDGRLELGIGAGWMTADYEKAGLPLDRPGVRIARLAESVAVLKGLFADGPFSFRGEHYTITDLDGDPKPVQRPHPPFVIGGGGPKILGLAAREADIVGINSNLRSGVAGDEAARSLAPPEIDAKLGWVREAAGDRFADLEITTLVGFVHETDDRAALAEGMAPAFGVPPADALHSPACLVGTLDEICDELEWRRDRWQMSYPVVPADAIDTFAPVVARLAGK